MVSLYKSKAYLSKAISNLYVSKIYFLDFMKKKPKFDIRESNCGKSNKLFIIKT